MTEQTYEAGDRVVVTFEAEVREEDFGRFLVTPPTDLNGLVYVDAHQMRIASALATPSASDGLPEGWKVKSLQRADGLMLNQTGESWLTSRSLLSIVNLGPATMSLSEACRAANERFPAVVEVEEPAPKWVRTSSDQWTRSDGAIVRQSKATGRWHFWNPELPAYTCVSFPTAEEAMAWADRERPVS
jgi:hypothetical protein